jgi:glycine cleavage system aminomethyltransferase T
LDAVVRQAGAVFAPHQGRSVAVNYGSAAGELAACVSAVGLADRSDLTKLVLEAPPDQMRRLMSRLAGGAVAPGGARLAAGAWWCGVSSERVVVLCDRRQGDRLHDQLHAHAAQQPTLRVEDQTADWAAIEVVGRYAGAVLRELGVYGESGDPRQVPPLTAHGGALWLLESDRKALALVAQPSAGTVWRAIERAGRRFGICAVGQDAITRYGLIRRAAL